MNRYIAAALALLIAAPVAAQVQNGPRMGLDGSIHSPSSSYAINGSTGVGSFNSVRDSRCVDINAYGGDRTGTNDNVAAFNAAVAASPALNVCVYLPAGTYKFASAPTVTLSTAYASITIKGDGAENTRLKYSANNLNGLNIAMTAVGESFHLRDFTMLAHNGSTINTGINISDTAASAMQSDISNITMRGEDGYNLTDTFSTFINLYQVSNVNFIGDSLFGAAGAAYATTGTGINLAGTSTILPIQFNIVATQINFVGAGLVWGPYVQGVQVSASNFTGDGIGINQPSTSQGNDQLSVSGSQFNCTRSIFLQQISDGVSIMGSDFYLAPGGPAAIETTGGQYSIMGNTLVQLAGGTNGNGIAIDQWAMDAGVITGNTFLGFTTGVLLQTNSQHVNVQSNAYSGVTNNVFNNGTNNTVGGGSQ